MKTMALALLAAAACGAAESSETLEDTGFSTLERLEYEPRWQLWSDGASKRRWLHVPAGELIDSSAMDAWRFPVGTRAYKEFTRDGVRVETRMLEKTAPGQWRAVAFAWNADGTEATAAPGGVTDALGTDHDIPDGDACWDCHGRASDALLGVSALQLAGEDLPWSDAPADYDLPGDATAAAALGYLHANCGNCHNDRNADNPLRLWLTVDALDSVEATPAHATAVGQPTQADPVAGIDADLIITPGAPDASALYLRMTTRGEGAMPFLGSEQVDPDGTAAVRAWIESLTAP